MFSKCQTGQTCCKLATGDYGCCPIPKAVCCTDGKHCCPEGTTCDVSAGKCNRGDLTVIDWIEKVPAIITDVICPDGQSKCQTGQTCCNWQLVIMVAVLYQRQFVALMENIVVLGELHVMYLLENVTVET